MSSASFWRRRQTSDFSIFAIKNVLLLLVDNRDDLLCGMRREFDWPETSGEISRCPGYRFQYYHSRSPWRAMVDTERRTSNKQNKSEFEKVVVSLCLGVPNPTPTQHSTLEAPHPNKLAFVRSNRKTNKPARSEEVRGSEEGS